RVSDFRTAADIQMYEATFINADNLSSDEIEENTNLLDQKILPSFCAQQITQCAPLGAVTPATCSTFTGDPQRSSIADICQRYEARTRGTSNAVFTDIAKESYCAILPDSIDCLCINRHLN